MRSRLILVFVLALGLLPACGGSGSDGATGTIVAGPDLFHLAFPRDDGTATMTAGFKNLIGTDATVHVQAFEPDGTPYDMAVPVLVPAFGEVQMPVAAFTASTVPSGGWLKVDTRDVGTLDGDGEPTPTSTSGFVVPYLQSRLGINESDAYPGLAFRSMTSNVAVLPRLDLYRIVNDSYLPMGGGSVPVAVDFDVAVYDAFGALASSFSTTVPPHGVSSFITAVDTGQVVVTPTAFPAQGAPVGTMFRFGAVGREREISTGFLTRDLFAGGIDASFRQVGFDLSFGTDAAGNVRDFALHMANLSTGGASVTIESIRRDDGAQLLAQPRSILLDAMTSRLEASSTLDSRGLEASEESVFDDIFGDVALAPGLTTFHVRVGVPDEVALSARDYDPFFDSYYRVVPGRQTTTDVMMPGVPVQTTTATGTRNYLVLMNLGVSDQTVSVRGFTPGGTEYVLPQLVVGAGQRVDYSPDGQIFREDPTDTNGPPVPFMSFRFSTSGGMWFGGRTERRDASDLLFFIRPTIIRDLRED